MLAELKQRDEEPEQDSLLKLYWNRAGVKRELASLQREHSELMEKLEEQEGDILRAQSQLEGLERLLADPLAAANAMVYFQLRHMWRVGASKLQQFAEELRQQREKRERQLLHNTVLAKRNRRLDAIRHKLGELLQKRKGVIEESRQVESRLENLGFLVRPFSAPALRRQIQGLSRNREALEERIEEFNEVIEKIQAEPLPEPEGLSAENQRLVNVACIALAQHLVVHFWENGLASLACKAARRTVGEMQFGDRRTCDQMVESIRERIESLNADRKLAERVKERTDQLVTEVTYTHETNVLPVQSAVAEIALSLAEEVEGKPVPTLRVNVLEENFWDLSGVLS